jgi:imidazolonepropionase-like amidohydrolase
MMSDDDERVLAVAAANARRALACGVTTVRDLGDRNFVTLSLRDTLAAEPWLAPELLVAGPPLTATGGHCWFLGGQADGVNGLPRAIVAHAGRGVDVIKIMATGGMLTPGWGLHESQYSQTELRAAADAAHGAGLPITAHAHGVSGRPHGLSGGF